MMYTCFAHGLLLNNLIFLLKVCNSCPEGQIRPDNSVRSIDSLGNYSLWEHQQGVCEIYQESNNYAVLIGVIAGVCALLLIVILSLVWFIHSRRKKGMLDDMWMIQPEEIKFSDPPVILGRGSFGLVLRTEYRGTVSVALCLHTLMAVFC